MNFHLTKSPFLKDITNPDILDSVGLSDCFCGEDRAIGLGVAFWLEALEAAEQAASPSPLKTETTMGCHAVS
jgi:hypothetical protein